MRRARIVRIEWEDIDGTELEVADIIQAFHAAATFRPDEHVTVTGEPSFDVEEKGEKG